MFISERKISPLDPDRSLVDRAINGSGEAFSELYAQLAPAVVGYLRAQGAREPNDLCSEVFLGVFKNMNTFVGAPAAFRSWVFSVAHRRLTDERRQTGRRPQSEDLFGSADIPGHGSTEQHASDRIGTRRVEMLCEGLPPDQRDVLLLRLVCGFTIDQAATAVGKSAGAAKALQRRGLQAIAEILDETEVTA